MQTRTIDYMAFSDQDLIRELRVRGYETFNPKEYAIEENLWTLDEAIDALKIVNQYNGTHHELSKPQLMGILNSVLQSDHVRQSIQEELERNIYEHLFED